MAHRYFFLLIWVLMVPLAGKADPLEFIRNDGQWSGPFNYKAASGGGTIFLAPDAFTYVLSHPANRDMIDAVHHGWTKDPVKLLFHSYKMSFVGASKDAMITAGKEQSWYYNYFIGNDPSRWKSGIHPALALDYTGVYPGINLHVSSEGDMLKYEWIIAEGKDPDIIRMRFEGTDGLSVKGGRLIIKTSVGDVQELKPMAYQYGNGGRKEVACRYHLSGNELSYSFPDGWDKSAPLIIDPTVVFCTLTGSTADNWGYTATYDGSGNFYAGGIMLSYPGSGGGSYPTSTGAFQTTFAGGVTDPNASTSDAHGVGFSSDIAIMKLNSTGTTRIWATYIGGSTDNEQPHSMMVDANNNLVIAGVSYSTDYPVTAGCYDNTANGGADIVVTKLNSTGTALIGSTYIGGSAADGVNYNGSEYLFGNLKYNYGDNARSEVILDKNANVYVTASTRSSNFPVTANAYQGSLGGAQDAVIMKLNPTLTTLTYSTYLGGTSDDAGYVLSLDTAQTHLYVAGGTMSSDFPTTGNGWKNSYQGGSADGYIARFLNSGNYTMQRMTFMGYSGYDQVYGVQVDLENSVYAMGQTLGGGFPVTSGVYSNSGSSQFVIKMDSLLTTDVFSTVFGSGSSSQTNISPVAFLVDTCQNIYISGWGGNLGFTSAPSSVGTTTGMPTTPSLISAPLKSTTDGFDFYFIVLAKNAANLLFGAYLGRNSSSSFQGEHVDGGTSRFDRQGIVYQGICANCGGPTTTPFPTTSGSWATSVGSSNCNEAALKIAFQLSVPDAIASASPKAKGCPPFTVQFQNNSVNSISYQWDFRDGSPLNTSFAPIHTFNNPGVYNVQLVVFNPNACKTRDTTYLTITVDSNKIASGFNFTILDSCGPYRASFTNTSQYSKTPGAAGRTQFLWIWGDGTTSSSVNPGIHSFPTAGTYTVTLVMTDTGACNSPDSVRKIISVNGVLVKASFQSPDSVCLKTALNFQDISMNATGITWYFGDGDTSTLSQVLHTYDTPGSYTVMLIAVNPNSCNKRDTLKKTIRIRKLPTADFTFAPNPPISNTPIDFTNKSKNADRYNWAFGDGSGSTDVNPRHLFRKTGTYRVCLTAETNEGCADSVCKTVSADVHTAIGVPTAFSPNGDGVNDILFAHGAAVESMNLKIYNRWGEKVFETNSLDKGWDGTYKGKPQEMDAYAYVLTATFIDGSTAQQQGNITLLR
jgi:gliding motility-associated-like protein